MARQVGMQMGRQVGIQVGIQVGMQVPCGTGLRSEPRTAIHSQLFAPPGLAGRQWRALPI